MMQQAILVLQLLLVHNVQKSPGIKFVSPLHQFGDTALPCTDDSDCITLGWKYGCFLYRCLNYIDSPLPRCQLSRTGSLCSAGEKCHWHPLLRGEGLCFPASHLQACSSTSTSTSTSLDSSTSTTSTSLAPASNCTNPGLQSCCGQWCCPQQYFRQWQNKKCFSHSECQTWGTGNFCCGDSCCDELPEEEEEEYKEYYYDYLDAEYIDEPWVDLDFKSSEDELINGTQLERDLEEAMEPIDAEDLPHPAEDRGNMSLLPQINLDAADIERKLFDAEREGEKDGISELSNTALSTSKSGGSSTDRANEAGTNDELNREEENSGGSLSLAAGESSFENKATDSLRQDDHLQPLFPPEVRKDEIDPNDETGSEEKAVFLADVNSVGGRLLGNNEENDSEWSQDDFLPLFPLLDLDEEEPSEITSAINHGEELEENLGNKVKINLELTESNQIPNIDKVDGGQTRAKNVSEQNSPPIDAEKDGTNVLDNDKEDKPEVNGSEERKGHLAKIVEENENGTTDLLPILTLGVEEEEEREKNETEGENSILSTGLGSLVSFEEVGGSGEEPDVEESDGDLSQEFLFDDDSALINSSLGEDEEPGYLVPLFQIEEEGETLIGNSAAEQGGLFDFETDQTKGNPAEENSSPNTLSAMEGGLNDGVVKEMEDAVAGKPDIGVEVGIDRVAVTENDFLALQDDHNQLPSSEEKDDNREDGGSEFHTISSVTPVLNGEEMDGSTKIEEDEEDGTVFTSLSSDSLAGMGNLDSGSISDGLKSQDNVDQSVYLEIQNIDRQGERHSGKSQGTSYLLPEIKIKYIGENSSLEDSFDESYVTEEEYILSEESFGDGSLQNAPGYELAIDKVEYDYESREEFDSEKREELSEEKEDELFASESLMPELKTFPPSETHLSSGWEEVETETRSNKDEESEDQDYRESKEGSQDTALLSEENPEEKLLREGDSLPGEKNPQNYRRPCIPYLGSHGEPRIVTTPLLFVFALTVLALQ